MNYKINYLKIETIDFKVQLGGMNIADVNSEVVSILEKTLDTNNMGQRNCGIIPYLDYILKCTRDSKALTMNDSIKEYFPQYYLWPDGEFIKEINTKPFYIMEKLDGDLTTYIIEQSYIKAYGSLELGPTLDIDTFWLYYETLPKIIDGKFRRKHGKYLSRDALVMLAAIQNAVIPHIKDILNNLQAKIIELHLNLLKRNHKYIDRKLDNIGYKILEDKRIKLYFIDIESGLSQIDKGVVLYQTVRSLIPEHENYIYQITKLSQDKRKATIQSRNRLNSAEYEEIDVDMLVTAYDKFTDFLTSHGLNSYLQDYSLFGQMLFRTIFIIMNGR